MKTIDKISPLSFGKIMAFILGTVGLFFSLLIFTVSFVEGTPESRFGMRLFAIAYPFLMALVGMIFGCLHAFIYNFAARFVGGIKVQISDSSDSK